MTPKMSWLEDGGGVLSRAKVKPRTLMTCMAMDLPLDAEEEKSGQNRSSTYLEAGMRNMC